MLITISAISDVYSDVTKLLRTYRGGIGPTSSTLLDAGMIQTIIYAGLCSAGSLGVTALAAEDRIANHFGRVP